MADNEPHPTTEPAPVEKRSFRRKGVRLFGLDLQDCIRYFFGGNASLAIVFLILICVFLLREAIMFFPDHHAGLKSYRRAGQELVDYITEETATHGKIYSSANIAYYAEVNRSSQGEDEILRAYRSVLANLERLTKKSRGALELKLERLEELDEEIEDIDSADPEAAAKLAALNVRRDELLPGIEEAREQLKQDAAELIDTEEAWNPGVGGKDPPEEVKPSIRMAVLAEIAPDAEDEHPYIQELKATSRAKKAESAEKYADFKGTLKEMQASVKPLNSLRKDLVEIARENRKEITSYETADERKAALLAGSEQGTDAKVQAEMREKAAAVNIIEPDYEKLNEPLYAAIPGHQELSAPFQIETRKLFEQLPDEFETKSARENMAKAAVYFERFDEAVEESRKKMSVWRHDKPLSAVESFNAFIFGRDWITNSSWHDFYGLLPLLSGSFLISLVALTVAVPFSVAAAIYVNQLAPTREQNLVKPTIEFIGAIPSVVLGFFGILVFGETLREVSQIEWLSWVPGFPMAERLTILNAGLLLAFMAVPTIFTLTEDALNNIPSAMTESSLAMGATKLQTVFRVILPTAVSGVVAAILLGFGRIIGETMVVLLVAGNKIKIPDFTEGIGVFMQPAHTMTGIIAQELGEVDSGSLHWRALFMVGMVLFLISLAVNFSAQRIMKKLQKL